MSRRIVQDNEFAILHDHAKRLRALEARAVDPTLVPSPNAATFVFIQASAAQTWTIAHGQNRYPTVTVVDSAGSVLLTSVQYLDANTVAVSFAGATTGRAYLN
jgi:hypothetical protein